MMNNGMISLFSYSDFDIVATSEESDREKIMKILGYLEPNVY